MDEFGELFEVKDFDDGETVFSQGDHGNEMFIVEEGAVQVIRDLDEGGEEIATLYPGDFFGEMAIFDELPRSATVRSAGPSTLRVISRKSIKSTIRTNPEMAMYLLEMMSRRIRQLDDVIERLMIERNGADS